MVLAGTSHTFTSQCHWRKGPLAVMSGLLLVIILSYGQACLSFVLIPSQRLGTGEYLDHSWSIIPPSGAQGLAQGASETGYLARCTMWLSTTTFWDGAYREEK